MNRRRYFIFQISALLAALLVVGCGSADDLVMPDPNPSNKFVISPSPKSMEQVLTLFKSPPSKNGKYHYPRSLYWTEEQVDFLSTPKDSRRGTFPDFSGHFLGYTLAERRAAEQQMMFPGN
jgi:hypothetical protein